MIVLDASAVVEALLRMPAAGPIERLLLDSGRTLHAPHLVDIEVAQVVRRYALMGQVDEERGREALDDLLALPIRRYAHGFLLPRVWELRPNMTAYDAMYVALAEMLDAALVTRDRRLAAVAGRYATVELV